MISEPNTNDRRLRRRVSQVGSLVESDDEITIISPTHSVSRAEEPNLHIYFGSEEEADEEEQNENMDDNSSDEESVYGSVSEPSVSETEEEEEEEDYDW